MKNLTSIIIISLLLGTSLCYGQTDGGISIGKGKDQAHPKSILDIVSQSRGLLIPRMSTDQRNAIFSSEDDSADGLLVFDTTENSFYFWNGKNWNALAAGNNSSVTGFEGTPTGTAQNNQLGYDSINQLLYIYSGNTWKLLNSDNDIQKLSLSGTVLSIENGNSIDLSSLQDGDNQQLSVSGNTLSISKGNSVTLPADSDNQTLSISGNALTISGGNSVTLPSGGTDSQTLSLSGASLSISGGNSVNLSSLQDGTGTDNQTLSVSGSTLSITGGNSVTLPLGSGSGDMLKSTYDTDNNNIADNSERVNGLTVQTAVPAGAVFTDSQTATQVAVTPNAVLGLSSNNVQSALEELQGEITTAATGGMTSVVHDATLTGNGITGSDLGLADDAVTSAKIANGTIAAADLSQMGANNGEVMKWNGTAWVAAADNDSQTATQVAVTPNAVLGLSSNNVQSALEELQGEITTATAGGMTSVVHDATLTGDGIAGSSLGIADNSVTSAKIDDGTIAASDLSAMGATNGQVMKYNGTAWVAANDNNSSITVEDVLNSTSSVNALSANMGRTLNLAVTAKLNSNASFGGDVSGTYNNIQINENVISTVELADGSVTSANIASNNIQLQHFSSMGASTGQILKYNGMSWLPANDENSITTVEDNLVSTSGVNALSANQGHILNTAVNAKLNSNASFGGDVSGTYDNLQIASGVIGSTEIADGSIAAADLSQMGASNGQVMKWNGTTWIASADETGGGTVTASNGLTSVGTDIRLGGANAITANTVVTQAPNVNLTFANSGTGRTIIGGITQLQGGVYVNVRTFTSFPSESDWLPTDFVVNIHVKGAGVFTLPNPADYPGRMLFIRNNSPAAGEAGLYGYSTYIPVNNGSVLPSRAQTLVSDGINWYVVAGS